MPPPAKQQRRPRRRSRTSAPSSSPKKKSGNGCRRPQSRGSGRREDRGPLRQLAAEQAKTVAAHEAVGRQTAEAKEAAELAAATAASIHEVAALEAQIAALHAAHAPTPPGGNTNSRVEKALALLGRPQTRPLEAAGDVTVLNQDEVAALTHVNEVSRLAHYKRSAIEESDNDSDDEVATSFFAPQIQVERTKAEERTDAHLSILHLLRRQEQGAGHRQGPHHLPRAVRGAEGPAQAAASLRQGHVP